MLLVTATNRDRGRRRQSGADAIAVPVDPNKSIAGGNSSRTGWNGGDEGTRTPDPRDANAVLSQLSYIPTGRRSISAPF